MIFTLDLLGSTIILACLWLLVIFSYMSGRMVKMGDPEDPHNNLMKPENDVNVCNYNVLGFGGTIDNKSDDIKCYVQAKVHNQSKTLWKLCNHTLYDVLHEAKNTKTLNVAVFIADINGEKRTTVWGDQQSDNLKKVFKQSVNEWRKVLHAGNPDDFRAEDHDIRIGTVVQPREDGGSQRYDAIAWPHDQDEEHGLIDFKKSGMENVGFRSHHANELRNLNFHLSVVFENSNSDDTYGYVVRRNYMTSSKDFIMGHCFTKGVTIYINDTMGADLPYDPWTNYFVIVFVSSFVFCVGLELVFFRKISETLVIFSLILSSYIAYNACNKIIQIPERPVVNGHPRRFSSDVFPVSLLTHELGHSLLMVDHYKVKTCATGAVVSTGLPGPTKPFPCQMTPVSVMGAENHITALDKAYVNAMWAMKQGRDYVYRSATGARLWEIKADAKADMIEHTARASTFIDNFVATNGINKDTKNDCADQSLLPLGTGGSNIRLQSMKDVPKDASTEDNKTLGPACITLGEIKDLFERSCAWNEAKQVYEPEAICNPLKEKRVTLTGGRYLLHQYMNVYSFPLEVLFVVFLTLQFHFLWKKNELKNIHNIVHGEQTLHYRELLDWPTIIAIILFILVTSIKARNVERCVGAEDSIASWVDGAIIFLALPMIPLLVRRTPLGRLVGLQREEVISKDSKYISRDTAEQNRLKKQIKLTP